MKLKIILFLILFPGTILCTAQGLYLKVSGGVSSPAGSQTLLEEYTIRPRPDQSTNTKTKSINGSYGAGVNINTSVGYKLSPFIGVDLNVNYFSGKKYSSYSSATTANQDEIELNQTIRGKGLFLSPTIMLMAGTGKVRPYSNIGVVFGKAKTFNDTHAELSQENNTTEYDAQRETTGNLSFGFRGGAGIDFNITKNISLFSEAIFTSMSFYPEESNYTSYIFNGEDQLDELTTYQKKIVYKDEFTTNNTQYDETEPKEELRSPLPFSNIAFNLGIKVKLGSD